MASINEELVLYAQVYLEGFIMKFFKSTNHQRQEGMERSVEKTEREIIYDDNESYFRSVYALPDYRLSIYMKTGSIIHFDFRNRLNTPEFCSLRDKDLFRSVHTDGNRLVFAKQGKAVVEITLKEFMDLILFDSKN